MNYTVSITQQAIDELDAAFLWLLRQTEQHAPAWYNRVLDAINSLERLPTRCPLAPENENHDEEVRHLIVGDRVHAYRIIFAIRGKEVVVLDVLHGARESR
ncbi:MAG TPA: type II toxin-antitoxin system RelE/ParE family toxin [Phycisphaerae bacterium]|nr:type II toxin-antitoxin system RelE/ParE family toxin [Phycisphaerae bacterium]